MSLEKDLTVQVVIQTIDFHGLFSFSWIKHKFSVGFHNRHGIKNRKKVLRVFMLNRHEQWIHFRFKLSYV